jgi:hypothetical protein
MSRRSRSLNLLEPQKPRQACRGKPLLLSRYFCAWYRQKYKCTCNMRIIIGTQSYCLFIQCTRIAHVQKKFCWSYPKLIKRWIYMLCSFAITVFCFVHKEDQFCTHDKSVSSKYWGFWNRTKGFHAPIREIHNNNFGKVTRLATRPFYGHLVSNVFKLIIYQP